MNTATRTTGGAQQLLKTFGVTSTRLVPNNEKEDDSKDDDDSSFEYMIGGIEAWLERKLKDDKSGCCSVLFLRHEDNVKVSADTTKMSQLRKLFETRLCAKYKQLESIVFKTIRPGEKFESYARDVMAELIRRRPWPERNDLIRWDLEHNCTFDGNPIECKWHRSRWQGNRQTSKSYDSVIAKHGSISSSSTSADLKSSGTPNPKYKLLLFDKLGSGSYGLVCRAISDEGKFVAVKIYDNAKIEKQNMTEDVAKELGVMIKLNRHHTAHVLRPPGHRNVCIHCFRCTHTTFGSL